MKVLKTLKEYTHTHTSSNLKEERRVVKSYSKVVIEKIKNRCLFSNQIVY